MSNQFKIRTPHAAVIVWNYVDRLGSGGTDKLQETEKAIISTLSLVSIQTSKSKSTPQGSFQLVLAPYKNWVSTITAGSWCAILMSNEPITEQDLQHANKKHVKMIGKIESVRVDTTISEDGARRTQFMVSGVDWGHIFNNTIYVDNLLAGPNDPQSQGNGVAVALRNAMFGDGGTQKSFAVADNLSSLIRIFGSSLKGFSKTGNDINRLAKSVYDFKMPNAMVEYFNIKNSSGARVRHQEMTKVLNLVTGSLKGPQKYYDGRESVGFIDPFSLQGTNSFWQILLENSNPALNEMIAELNWDDGPSDGMSFTLYNRIKPFSFKGFNPRAAVPKGPKSMFQYLKTHDIENDTVMSINAGTNWRDKCNFIEIKPEFQDFNIFANWSKKKTQNADPDAFEREGFRPMIVGTKQFPTKGASGTPISVDFDQLPGWTELMREWYFDTHRMLNGTLVMVGTTDYIGVGENIRFDAGLINPTPNINKSSYNAQKNQFVLAHVENISHSFSVTPDGARTYTTTIQFVRGLIVNGENVSAEQGLLDKMVDNPGPDGDKNTTNVASTSEDRDPDPQKVKGR
jgi:hypothetical protein